VDILAGECDGMLQVAGIVVSGVLMHFVAKLCRW
jgi:hypothetical protein